MFCFTRYGILKVLERECGVFFLIFGFGFGLVLLDC